MKILLLIIATVSALATVALAHGDAAWIMREPRFVTVNGVHCCGPSDCQRAPRGAVERIGSGYRIAATGQSIPADWKALYTSIDADDWWCRDGAGRVKCLFVPLTGA